MKPIRLLVLTFVVSGIILVTDQSTFAQSQRINSTIRSFEDEQSTEQIPQVVQEVSVSKKRVIFTVAITAGVTVCELSSRRCSNALSIVREALGSSQPPVSPQMFNHQIQRLSPKRRITLPF